MLAGVVDYVLLGHSDRRAAGETDELIARKVRAAAVAGLTPVLFVGEDTPTGAAADLAEQRLIRGLAELDLDQHGVLVVYEPTWAIGADAPADPGQVRHVVAQLKQRLTTLGAGSAEIIYGGTVTADNLGQFLGIELLDGVGATRAGLVDREFLRIVAQVAAAGLAARGPLS
jgi:triosephosphate isomerase